MRFLTYLAALALVGWAATASAEPTVRVLTTGPDDAGAACGVCVVGAEPGVHVVELGGPENAAAWASTHAIPSGPPTKMNLPYLGVATASPDETLRKQLGLAPGTGLVVEYVDEDGPAQKAGVRAHDVLTKLGDQILVNPPQLAVLVRMHQAGDRVPLTLMRGGKEQRASATLIEKEQVVAAGAPGWASFGAVAPPVPPRILQNLLKPGNVEIEIKPQTGAGGGEKNARRATGSTVATAFSMTMADGEHTLTVEQRDGKRHLVAKDADGNVLFDGPIGTDAERARVPEAVRNKLDRMAPHVDVRLHVDDLLKNAEKSRRNAQDRAETARKKIQQKTEQMKTPRSRTEVHSSGGHSHAEVHIQDDAHDLRVTSRDGKRHLVAKDADGKVLFDGPITTDAEMQRVPEAIRNKVRGIQIHATGAQGGGAAL